MALLVCFIEKSCVKNLDVIAVAGALWAVLRWPLSEEPKGLTLSVAGSFTCYLDLSPLVGKS